jgi:hypothetical protein
MKLQICLQNIKHMLEVKTALFNTVHEVLTASENT